MNRINRLLLSSGMAVLFLCGGVSKSPASSTIPLTLEQHVNYSGAVFRGTVADLQSFTDANDGMIYTRAFIEVDEAFKGTLPSAIKVVHRGGVVGGRGSFFGLSPQFRVGGEYLLFVNRREDGQLTCTQGDASALWLQREKSAKGKGELTTADQALLAQVRATVNASTASGEDVTDQAGAVTTRATTGLLTHTNGIASRFTLQDRAETIPYLIDAANWPAGLTLAQATNAVHQAFNAWSAVTSLKFKFEGFANFGTNAFHLAAEDQRMYIQLHDNYNFINNTNVLGVGGCEFYTDLPASGWGPGGNVAGNEFYQSFHGYLVLERTNTTMQNAQTLAEVLCHEIGHALSMAHSFGTNTTNPLLTNSIMFYQVHADGRGAALGAYDPPVIQQSYPTNNTPPWTFERVMDVTTIPSGAPNLPGINELEMRGYDLQTTNLSLITTNPFNNGGTFSVVGKLVKFTPSGFIGADRSDPGDGSYYARIFARISDGTNASPYVTARVISFNPDQGGFPTLASDGIPDDWMTTYFTNIVPNATAKTRAQDDFDGDGLINLREYRTGMNPTNAASRQRLTITRTNIQFQAMPYELYELHGSTNLTNWVRAVNPLMPTTTTGIFTNYANGPYRFFRLEKVP